MAVFCPECKTNIKEGQVYCPNCGYDIQMVPEFDARIELEIDEAMSGILEGLNLEDLTLEERQTLARTHDIQATKDIRDRLLNKSTTEIKSKDTDAKAVEKDLKRPPRRLLLFLTAAVIIIIILVVITITQPKDAGDYLIEADIEMNNGNYDNARVLLLEAMEKEPDNPEVRLMLGKAFLYLHDEAEMAKYLYPLKDADDTKAYDILLEYYIENNEMPKVTKELSQCDNEEILQKYKDYIAEAPYFSVDEGVYTEPVSVGIKCNQEGNIYYTLDGSEPDENSSEYTGPIFLERGKNVVRAVYINERGAKSESISGIFEIEEPRIADPVVLTTSGDYDKAVYIKVEEESDCSVYYTTDGTMPDTTSRRYEGVLPMPMGDSLFKFVAIDVSGRRSDITSSNYNLSVPAMCRENEAVNFCVMSLMATGKLADTYGNSADGKNKYKYKCIGIHSENESNYYIIEETMTGEEYDVETGDYYAVDTVTGSLMRAGRSDEGYFYLRAF